jgi:hypothetical protein
MAPVFVSTSPVIGVGVSGSSAAQPATAATTDAAVHSNTRRRLFIVIGPSLQQPARGRLYVRGGMNARLGVGDAAKRFFTLLAIGSH